VEICKATPEARDMPELSLLTSAIQAHCNIDGGSGNADSSESTATTDR
jgi:hypothetical protein